LTKKSQKNSDRAQEYDGLIWAETFKSHGIGEKFHNSWFFNYETDTEKQKKNLEGMKAYCRRNTSIALIGDVGRGKTHLATAVLKDAIICGQKRPERKSFEKQNGQDHFYYQKPVYAGHYYTLLDLHRRYRESQKSDEISEVDFMDRIYTMKCLVIDEIQIKSDSESEQRMFQDIIDRRYANNLQTIYIGNVSYSSLCEIIGKRLMDRLEENGLKIMTFKGDSYRSKNSDL